jgi:hypothetical protein
MKLARWTAIFFALALLICAAIPVCAFEIGARGLYWFPTFKADMRSDSAGLTGTTLNLQDNLGVGNDSFPAVEAFWGVGKHRLSLAYTPVAYSGSARLTAPVTFNGRIFSAGTNVDTDLKLRMVDLEYQYKFLDMENILAGFSFAFIGQIKYVDGEAKMNAPAAKIESHFSVRAPVPMVGLGAHVGLLAGLLEARAKMTGIAYSDSRLIEALADLSLTPFPFLDIHAGYKLIRLKIDHRDNFLDSEFAGPYVGLTVSF